MTSGISNVTNTSSTASSSGASGNGSEIASNFTQFLTLLTTQLKNQNPLDPMDTNQFTQQLVQFAGVEQQLKSNDRLDSILTASKSASSASATSYIGKSITADGSSSQLSNGAASWTLTPARAASKAVVTILDSKNNVVASQSTSLTAGSQTYGWNGKTSAGLTAPDGTYTIKVSASDATGANVAVDTQLNGTVDSVDLSGAAPVLMIGSQKVPLSSVQSIGLSTSGT
ncbi:MULTISPECIES: flagellar hook capping FlgD N-terminal domain-containing protein [unclassified Methylobacterium]|uniref:flagellar hook assembly protein FlgD n=1 Tax=unclassified Methylobacterium TaxID=2615210 RepID=UPI0011C1F054|nr:MULTISPECIES: flagellar hook capping FlgD N-terminal domain-containing protein [unclassified Methylobacterium]QEE42242.1 flagellar hook assembly protein FlgD [Methylobacterium sp. WL1]TXN03604.1 flagellar hook assembly protein FlgD [Methylobacterium sp. WL64]TXN54477.1 flagellar hook assembly protein FlgD [Methylobacterium sp. WL2]